MLRALCRFDLLFVKDHYFQFSGLGGFEQIQNWWLSKQCGLEPLLSLMGTRKIQAKKLKGTQCMFFCETGSTLCTHTDISEDSCRIQSLIQGGQKLPPGCFFAPFIPLGSPFLLLISLLLSWNLLLASSYPHKKKKQKTASLPNLKWNLNKWTNRSKLTANNPNHRKSVTKKLQANKHAMQIAEIGKE